MSLLSTVLLSEGSMIDLDGTVLFQLGLFFVAYIFLYFLVFRPMIALITAREEAIDGAKEEAARLVSQAEGLDSEFDEKLEAIRVEATAERENLRKSGLAREAEILEAARQATEAELAKAEKELAAEAARIRADLAKTTPIIAQEIASRLLGRKVA
ncbi:MAG: ATP synthase F0 subunit B [Sandaracinaceae bacterium]|nr:ATP synthase F0 subunit B [Sandaracinaceae bacterium]